MMMWMMGLGLIVPLLLIGLVVYALGWRPQLDQNWPARSNQTALEILKERYARGEITRQEYEATKLDLED